MLKNIFPISQKRAWTVRLAPAKMHLPVNIKSIKYIQIYTTYIQNIYKANKEIT